jgi:hypothetical protein
MKRSFTVQRPLRWLEQTCETDEAAEGYGIDDVDPPILAEFRRALRVARLVHAGVKLSAIAR